MERYTQLGVYGILVKDNKILLIRKSRGPHTGKWDLPGGRMEFGEQPYEALKREFLEETGISELEGTIKTATSYTITYPFKVNQLEELHHIGIIYDVKLLSDRFQLKTEGDQHDSLGAEWICLDDLHNLEITPFVKEVFHT
ncbi:NUDIX hydrolase [Paenibacillus assamensis]|uniref:NUDIX hydrolase n=1 Tax=Paenibacillus assamensis TaxID=311244 RepID=UPI00048FE36E|nr:NUDIX domain-containing protein [Paenibacillus assamensis]